MTTSAERLRAAGLRVTTPRLAVLDALDAARVAGGDHHLTVADVAARVRERRGFPTTSWPAWRTSARTARATSPACG